MLTQNDGSDPIGSIIRRPVPSMVKARILYVFAFLAAIALGLGSRQFSTDLPAFVVKHFGDILWASMVYFGFRLLFTKQSFLFVLITSLLFCYGIEFSQMYQAGWIQEIRATRLGSLILGRGFLGVDLIRYIVGAAAAFGVDRTVIRGRQSNR